VSSGTNVKGQEVGHVKLAGSEERTVGVDLLSYGTSPHPLPWSQAPPSS
jgi:hypothetical protein